LIAARSAPLATIVRPYGRGDHVIGKRSSDAPATPHRPKKPLQPPAARPKSPPRPPTNPADLAFVALDTHTPYTLDFDGADGGKNANYLLRWVNPAGEKGPPALDGPPRAKPAVAQRRV
jgi:type IV secretory pathway VirB10-like protein